MPLISIHILAAAGDGGFLPARLMACGVKLVRHLFDPSSGQWLDPCIFQRHFRGLRPPSLRLIEHEFRLLRSALSQCFPTLFLEKGCHLPDSVALQTDPLFPSSPVNFVSKMDWSQRRKSPIESSIMNSTICLLRSFHTGMTLAILNHPQN